LIHDRDFSFINLMIESLEILWNIYLGSIIFYLIIISQ